MEPIKITQYLVPAGRRNRPHTNPKSSLYRKVMEPIHIVFHNAYFSKGAKELAIYCASERAAARPASWQENVDDKEVYESIPTNEQAWHAGCNLCKGNVLSIGYEICDYPMLWKDQDLDLFLKCVDNACLLAAYHLLTIPSLSTLPFREMMTQHWHWSGKNCPSWIRAMKDGWQNVLDSTWDYYTEMKKPQEEEIAEKEVAIVQDEEPEIVKDEEPDLPEELVIGEDPDLDRDWIDNHPEEYEEGKDPYEDRRKVSAKLYGDPHAKISIYKPKTKTIPRHDWVRRSRGLWGRK